MKTCLFCKGYVELKKISHLHKWGNEYYLFENVQAEVCSQCGEVFFLPDTLKLMDEYVREKKSSKKTICIPVIKMPDMAEKNKKGMVLYNCHSRENGNPVKSIASGFLLSQE